MALSDIVNVVISASAPGLARASFGLPLIVSYTATWVERVRTYKSLAAVGSDFAIDSPEYLAAAAIFAQSPHPSSIKIGRAALAPTQRYVIGVASVKNSTLVTGASDPSATNDEIIDALVTALNAVVGKNYTAVATGAGGSHVCTATGSAAGDWFALEVADRTLLTIAQTHADPGSATDLAAIKLADSGWYGLYTTFNSAALLLAVAAWAETAGIEYFGDSNQSAVATSAVGDGDSLDALKTASYFRTAGWYHPNPKSMLGAAVMGRCFPKDPGKVSFAHKRLAGVVPVVLTDTELTNILAKNANTYYEVAPGLPITWKGKVAAGEWIDVIRNRDWSANDMQVGIVNAFVAADIVPMSNPGIATIETEVKSSLRRGVNNGVYLDDDNLTVTVPDVADVSDADRQARNLSGIAFSARLAGAIIIVDPISGTVTE
jgi:hypothetical protein